MKHGAERWLPLVYVALGLVVLTALCSRASAQTAGQYYVVDNSDALQNTGGWLSGFNGNWDDDGDLVSGSGYGGSYTYKGAYQLVPAESYFYFRAKPGTYRIYATWPARPSSYAGISVASRVGWGAQSTSIENEFFDQAVESEEDVVLGGRPFQLLGTVVVEDGPTDANLFVRFESISQKERVMDAIAYVLEESAPDPPHAPSAPTISQRYHNGDWLLRFQLNAAETGPEVVSWEIQQSDSPSGPWTRIGTLTPAVEGSGGNIPATTTSFEPASISHPPGTTRYYRTIAYAGDDTSGAASPATSFVLDPAEVAAPTGLSATVNGNSVLLGWTDTTPSDDDLDTEEEFVVERKAPGGEWVEAGRTAKHATSFEVTGLMAGTEYQFRVRGERGGNHPSQSAWVETSATTEALEGFESSHGDYGWGQHVGGDVMLVPRMMRVDKVAWGLAVQNPWILWPGDNQLPCGTRQFTFRTMVTFPETVDEANPTGRSLERIHVITVGRNGHIRVETSWGVNSVYNGPFHVAQMSDGNGLGGLSPLELRGLLDDAAFLLEGEAEGELDEDQEASLAIWGPHRERWKQFARDLVKSMTEEFVDMRAWIPRCPSENFDEAGASGAGGGSSGWNPGTYTREYGDGSASLKDGELDEDLREKLEELKGEEEWLRASSAAEVGLKTPLEGLGFQEVPEAWNFTVHLSPDPEVSDGWVKVQRDTIGLIRGFFELCIWGWMLGSIVQTLRQW